MGNIIIIFFVIILLVCLYKKNKFKGGKIKLHKAIRILIICCKKLNLKYNLLDKNNIHIIHNNEILKYRYTLHNINRNICKKIKCNKSNINKKLIENKIKVPIHEVFDKVESLEYIDYIIKTKTIKYPLVVKPIDSMGGVKVFINIKNDTELKNILTEHFLNKIIPKSKTHKIMLESYIIGTDYRIICYNDIILDIIRRTPGYVIGDGIHTIKELTDIKNKTDKYHKKHPIIINEPYLNSINLSSNYVIELKKRVNPHYIGTIDYGGYLHRVSIKEVHKDNLEMFKKINKILGLKISGADILIEDISKSYKIQNCGINEVNTSPNILTSYYADEKYSLHIPMKFLKLHFNIKNSK